jgi:Domain of unknown function (DUF4389)
MNPVRRSPRPPTRSSEPVTAMPSETYPLRLHARIDQPLSRWLWLIKPILVTPHLVVLAFLWAVTLGLTVIAGVMILITGRYPRSVFDVTTGVLRWTWRVAYYCWGGFGTDRYPPFSLRPRPGYPADLAIDYPPHLSRGLVLVKWLLAVPHLLITAVLIGGGTFAGWQIGGWQLGGWQIGGWAWTSWNGGLIALLALAGAVVLAITGSYPRALFDVVTGLDRWVFRVAAFTLLLTDEYPPFRVDLGDSPEPAAQTRAGPVDSPQPMADRPPGNRP